MVVQNRLFRYRVCASRRGLSGLVERLCAILGTMILLLFTACAEGKPPAGDSTAGDSSAKDTDLRETGDTAEPVVLLEEAFDGIDPLIWDHATWQLGATRFREQNGQIVRGELELLHEGAGDRWFGAELFTLQAFTAGADEATVFEATLTAPDAPGTVCAMFLYGEAGGVVDEIDIELLDGRAMVGTYAGWRPADGYENGPTRQYRVLEADISGTHRYGIRWDAAAVSFWIDGEEQAVIAEAVPGGAPSLRFNHWTSTTWGEVGYPPPAELRCTVDDVRVEAGP